jgi:photosystem II stability/assembly factor-like uncharacterized protein
MKPAFLVLLLLNVTGLHISHAQIDAEFESSNISAHTLVTSSFINDNDGWAVDDQGMLRRTTNAGLLWDSVSSGIKFLEIDFTDAETGFGVSKDGAYKTSNGGSTWTQLSLPESIGQALYFVNNGSGFISGFGGLYKTIDGGNAWLQISTNGATFTDYCFIDELVGLAAADDESGRTIWRTADGGATWNAVFEEENYFINALWFTDAKTGWAAGYYEKP